MPGSDDKSVLLQPRGNGKLDIGSEIAIGPLRTIVWSVVSGAEIDGDMTFTLKTVDDALHAILPFEFEEARGHYYHIKKKKSRMKK
jgi:hypothetical protein